MFRNETLYDGIIIAEVAKLPALARAGVPPRPPVALVKAIIARESGFDPRAHNAEGSPDPGDDSFGLMQVRLPTARGLGFTGRPEQLYEPQTNIHLGVKLLGDLWARWPGREDAVAAAYNAGMKKDGTLKVRSDGTFINTAYVVAVQRYLDYFRGVAPAPVGAAVQTAGFDRGALFWLALVLLAAAFTGRRPDDD